MTRQHHLDASDTLARLDCSAGLAALRGVRIGLEKESLRVDESGHIARTPHPAGLGSALTHPHITTDFSEALMEFVTPPFESSEESLRFLRDLHAFTYQHLGQELLWCTSMPCMVGADECIPIADYGTSNVGSMKRVYRQGLSHRYGSTMKTIAGVHFNISLPQAFWGLLHDGGTASRRRVDAGYFGCVRNFLRYGWLVPLLFGSSPAAICKSFLGGNPGGFQELDDGTLYEPYATSLRMSDIGYTNANQAALQVDYDGLDGYVRSLGAAIATPHPDYEAIGVVEDGHYKQLNANLLQIENEFYSSIRPKQITQSGEKPTVALRRRGVRYVEVRSLDLDPFSCVGVNGTSLRIMEALVVLCALLPSPSLSEEMEDIKHAMAAVPRQGRDPALSLRVAGRSAPALRHAQDVLHMLEPVCALLDRAHDGERYRHALECQREAVADPDQLPSARVLQRLREEAVPFFRFAMNRSQHHAETLRARPLTSAQKRRFQEQARQSLEQQRLIEAADRIDFDEYLRRYFDQTLDQREKLLG
jgi:glutamate--cysteine ligase